MHEQIVIKMYVKT